MATFGAVCWCEPIEYCSGVGTDGGRLGLIADDRDAGICVY